MGAGSYPRSDRLRGNGSQAYVQGMLLFPFRLVWVLVIGVPVALLLFTLSALFFVTVVSIPVAIVLAVLATKALSAPFSPPAVRRSAHELVDTTDTSGFGRWDAPRLWERDSA